jgi:D-arabinose 1-dehydrogenase-like Zn-dependent alcohol dehydrogenase
MAGANIPKTMKGLQITEFKKPYRLSKDIPVPKIERDNEILIKIAVAGYCHTEMMVQNGEFESKMVGNGLPIIPSHEGVGVVVAVGSGVSKIKVGTSCFYSTSSSCRAGWRSSWKPSNEEPLRELLRLQERAP